MGCLWWFGESFHSQSTGESDLFWYFNWLTFYFSVRTFISGTTVLWCVELLTWLNLMMCEIKCFYFRFVSPAFSFILKWRIYEWIVMHSFVFVNELWGFHFSLWINVTSCFFNLKFPLRHWGFPNCEFQFSFFWEGISISTKIGGLKDFLFECFLGL